MQNKKNKYLEWDLNKLKDALDLDEEDIKKYFTDGRRVSFLTERKLARAYSGRLAKSEGAGYDLVLPGEKKWEVRSLTKNIYFCPSKMVGSSRSFEEEGFLKKLDEIEGYFVCDITQFPKIPYISIASQLIREHYFSGKLGTTSRISRNQFFTLFRKL